MRLSSRIPIGGALAFTLVMAVGATSPKPPPPESGAPESIESTARVPRIAIQAGHWKAAEAPDELRRIRTNGTPLGNPSPSGRSTWTSLNGQRPSFAHWDTRWMSFPPWFRPPIAPTSLSLSMRMELRTARPRAIGLAASRRDRTGRGQEIAQLLSRTYGEATGLRHLPTNTRRMTNYYAFNDRRYRHSIDPATIGIIIETGFLTSPEDRSVIIDDPERSANGIVAAVTAFELTRHARPPTGALTQDALTLDCADGSSSRPDLLPELGELLIGVVHGLHRHVIQFLAHLLAQETPAGRRGAHPDPNPETVRCRDPGS